MEGLEGFKTAECNRGNKEEESGRRRERSVVMRCNVWCLYDCQAVSASPLRAVRARRAKRESFVSPARKSRKGVSAISPVLAREGAATFHVTPRSLSPCYATDDVFTAAVAVSRGLLVWVCDCCR